MTRSRSRLTLLAHSLRKAENAPEARLWLALKGRKLDGHKFRRQVPIGDYVADFACVDLRLVVELDGSQHIDNQADRLRDDIMMRNGWSIVRFPSLHMLTQPETVIDTLLAICDGKLAGPISDHDFRLLPAKNPSSGPSGHLLPLKGEKWKEEEAGYMDKALKLGLAQLGRTAPNPPVGCVLVRDGEVVGQGATGDGGRPHAEEVALDQAGDRARGATAYVTLEPCGQRSNGCASCSQKLAEAGVARVVYACDDPSPFASRQGPQRLEAAGIVCESGLLADDCAVLIAGFVHWLDTGRPQVTETGRGPVDAIFTADPQADLEAELKVWGDRGFRMLSVEPGSQLRDALHRKGLLSE